MIEGLETEEEEEEVMNDGILEVAEICNQNHFSGMTNLNVIASEWVIVHCTMCRSDNSEASLLGRLPWRAEEPASLHPQPGQVAPAGNV